MKRRILAISTIALGAVLLLILIGVFWVNSRSDGDGVDVNEISSADIAKHNTADNCWVSIGGNVYSLSRYFNAKPDAQLAGQLCGKVEPDIKLPAKLNKETIVTYRIGVLSP